MDIDEMVPILTAKVEEFERKKAAGIHIKKTMLRHHYQKKFKRNRAAAKTVQRIHRARIARRRFLTLIAICVEVNRELKAQREREEAERRRQQEELERQMAEQRKQEEERLKAEEEERLQQEAEAAKLAESDEAAAEKMKAELEAQREAAAAEAAEKQKELEAQAEALEKASANEAEAPAGFERLLAGQLMDEPDIGSRLSGGEAGIKGDGSSEVIKKMGRMGISKDIISRVSMRFVDAEKQRKVALEDEEDEEDEDDFEDEDEDDDDDDDELTLGHRAAGDDKVFEVVIMRHETTGSLGLELDEYKGSPTVCAIMLGGPADQDGTLQMGDTVVAIDGKPTHNMEDVKRAVISASSTSLRLAVLRKPVVVMRRERAYMNMPDIPEDEEWEQFEITLFSNRQLTFEKLSPPFVFGSIELPAAKSLRLMKVQYNVCLQIATNERSFEFYTDSLMTLYEWHRMLRSLMLSNTVSVMSGWLTLIAEQEMQLKRWWFDLCGSTHELCYFETDQCQALNLPAQGCIDLADVRVIEPISTDALRPLIDERKKKDSGELIEHVRLMCDVHRQDDSLPIGLELSPDFQITRFGKGSPSELSSEQGGLQVGDLILAVDGHEVDAGAQKKKKTKAVKELLRDLDTFPKQVHTFTVERSVPVVMQDGGALQIKAKGDHWILYPCSSDEVPLAANEYAEALTSWTTKLKESAKEAREAADGAGAEQVLQQLWVELDEEDDWKAYWCTLTVKNGLSFYEDKSDAQSDPDNPACVLHLDEIRGAGRAPGIDFYDGVIDIELHGSSDMWRIRPTGHAAMHNLLSAINIYKMAPAPGGAQGGATNRRGAKGGATTRGATGRGGATARAGLGGQTSRKQSVLGRRGGGGGPASSRKQSVIGGLTTRAFGRKESVVGNARAPGSNLPLGGGLAGSLEALKNGILEEDEDDTYASGGGGMFAAPNRSPSNLKRSSSRGVLGSRKSGNKDAPQTGRKFSVMPGFLSKR